MEKEREERGSSVAANGFRVETHQCQHKVLPRLLRFTMLHDEEQVQSQW